MQRSAAGELVYHALQYHADWRVRIKQAIRDGTIDENPEDLGTDEQCPFGKWLAHEIDPHYQRDAEYAVVKETHRRFHFELARIALDVRNGSTASACEKIATGSEFSELSSAMSRELTRWLAKIETLGRKTQAA